MTHLSGLPGGGLEALLGIIVTVLLLATASAFTTGMIVEDFVTEPLRQWIWRRWPYEGKGAPIELEGSAFEDAGRKWQLSPGTWIGQLFTCTRCFGVWSMAAWCLLWWLAPGITTALAAFCAACQVQRWWSAQTALNRR